MEKKFQQAGWWSLIIAGLAGAAYVPYRPASPAGQERAGTVSAPIQTADASPDAQPSDALTLVGQYFSIDVTEAGLRRRLLAVGDRFKPESRRPRSQCPDPQENWPAGLDARQREICEDHDTLSTFFGLDIDPRTPGLLRARNAFVTIGSCLRDGDQTACSTAMDRKDDGALRRFLRDYLDEEALRVSNPPLPKRRAASEFSRLNRSRLAQLDVSHAARRSDTELSFLVATVPDGVDSYAGWSFDPATDAIRRAAERAGYVMDRFFLPDWSNRGSGSALGRTHEEQPGAILLRGRSEENGPQALLVILLALETPTAGVHSIAMDRALRLAGWWRGAGAYPELRILGPYYSGTTSSLQRSLRRVLPALKVDSALEVNPARKANPAPKIPDVRIITGSATTLKNQEDLEDPDGTKYVLRDGPKVSFTATTLPDNRCELRRQLRERFGVVRMAWLTESTTAYGKAQLRSDAVSVPQSGNCPEDLDDVTFTFPLHISRLRDLSPSAPADRQPLGTLLPLVLREAFTPSDTFPSLSPTLTSATAEITLRNLGRLISRETIRVVGILATDARDKLFLARAIRQMHPSVSFVTTEANVLYSHPDYSDCVRGMLVASSYPLTSFVEEAVRADEAEAGRVLFSSAAAEGIYNAALLQLSWPTTPAERKTGNSVGVSAQPSKEPTSLFTWSGDMLPFIYGRESILDEKTPRRPSVWLSLVGREDAWPIGWTAVTQPSTDSDAGKNGNVKYTFGAPNSRPNEKVKHEWRHVHAGVVMGYLVFSAIAFFHLTAFLFGWPTYLKRLMIPGRLTVLEPDAQKPSARSRKNRGGRHRRQFACFSSLTIAYATCVLLQLIWSRQLGVLAGLVSIASAAIVVSLIGVCVVSGRKILSTLHGWKEGQKHNDPETKRNRMKRAVYSLLLVSAGGSCVTLWTLYIVGLYQSLPPYGGLVVERYARLSNGLSPVLPLVLLASAVYVWGFLDLTSHPFPVNRRFNDSLELLNHLTNATARTIEKERAGVVTARLVTVLVVMLALALLLFGVTPVFSFEGRLFSVRYTMATLLVHALVAGKLIAVWYRWSVIAKHLEALARSTHPIVNMIVSRSPAENPDKKQEKNEKPEEELSLPEFNAGLLFKGPSLDEVETLIREYETTVCSAPRLLLDGLLDDENASLSDLKKHEGNLRRRWTRPHSASTPPELAFHLLALLNPRDFGDLFEQTVKAAQAAAPEPVATPVMMARGIGAAQGTAAAAGRLMKAHPEISERWHAVFGHCMQGEMETAHVMFWVALQPEAKEIQALLEHLPAPVSLRTALEKDLKDASDVSGANSFAWEALTNRTMDAVHAGSLRGVAVCKKRGCFEADQHAISRFFALYLFSSIRMALWRIWRPLLFVIAAILLVTLSHLVYPIQPRTLLVMVPAGEALVAAALAVRALLTIERNAILSRLTGGNADQIDWSWRFAGRLAAWVALPILGVVATRFPDVGDFVLRLFSPFEALTR